MANQNLMQDPINDDATAEERAFSIAPNFFQQDLSEDDYLLQDNASSEQSRDDENGHELTEEDLADPDLIEEDLAEQEWDEPHSTQPAMPEDEVPSSRYIVRSIDGLRMALAGFPANQPVRLGDGCGFDAETIADLRVLPQVPQAIEVLVPYRLLPESIVRVSPLAPAWRDSER